MSGPSAQEKICNNLSPQITHFLLQMREMGQKRNIPNISWDTANFFKEILSQRQIVNILEIGPANGFSTMMLSIACPHAHITTLECSRHAFEELRHNIQVFSLMNNEKGIMKNEGMTFHPADFPPKVTSDIHQETIKQFSLYYGDAREILPAFMHGAQKIDCTNPESVLYDIPQQKFDFIFIDGAFRMTREFFDLSCPLLTPKGIVIIDDAIKYRWKMEGFHEYLEKRGISYELVQTDEDDGVMVINL